MVVHSGVQTGRRERRKALTHAALLDAAQQVLLVRGYRDAGVEEIARIADVAVGSVYTYFGSKEGLFRALVERAVAADESALDQATDSDDPMARLAAVREAIGR